MFQDLIKDIDNTISSMKSNLEVVKYLEFRLVELNQIKKDLLQATKDYNPYKAALDNVKDDAPSILWKEAEKALVSSEEFDLPIFRNRLERAIFNPKTVSLAVAGNRLEVIVNLDQTAGTLDDYANAIKATRELIRKRNKGRYIKDPQVASQIWKEKIYGSAREGKNIEPLTPNRKNRTSIYRQQYRWTINTRVAHFQSLAPFWRILNNGTVPLASSWGGTEYPRTKPTDFVGKSTQEIRRQFTEYVKIAKDYLAEINQNVKYIDSAISYIQTISKQILENPERKFILEQIQRILGGKFSEANQNRLNQLLEGLISGTLTQEKFRLGTTAAGIEIRPRIKRIQNALRQYRSK